MPERPTPPPRRQLTLADFQGVFQGEPLPRDSSLKLVRWQRERLAKFAGDVRRWMELGPANAPAYQHVAFLTFGIQGSVGGKGTAALGLAVKVLWEKIRSITVMNLSPSAIADEVATVLRECDKVVAELDEVLRVEEAEGSQ